MDLVVLGLFGFYQLPFGGAVLARFRVATYAASVIADYSHSALQLFLYAVSFDRGISHVWCEAGSFDNRARIWDRRHLGLDERHVPHDLFDMD